MGDPRKLRWKFERPRKVWDKRRIQEEKGMLVEYGLRSMHELWRMKTMAKTYNREARSLQAMGDRGLENAQKILAKARKYGLVKEGSTLDDLLGLTVRDILERRLQTIVMKKGFSKTMKEARQLIVHRHVVVGDRKVSAPSYLVPIDEDAKIMRA